MKKSEHELEVHLRRLVEHIKATPVTLTNRATLLGLVNAGVWFRLRHQVRPGVPRSGFVCRMRENRSA